MKARIWPWLLAAGLAGCGGGGNAAMQPAGSAAPAAQTPVTAGGTSSIVTTIVVPGPGGTLSAHRSTQYISASTLSLKVVVTDIPPTGAVPSFVPTTSVYALAIGPNTIVVPTPASAPGHTEDLTYVAYNLAPVAGAIPAGAKALGWGLVTNFSVVPGANSSNVVLSGVVDGFPAPLVETGAFGMMSSTPPALAGTQTSLGFGGALVPTGVPTFNDAGGNSISAAAGAPWPIIGAIPLAATTPTTGVPVSIVETAGTCGAIGAAPHLQLSYNGAAGLASTAALLQSSDSVSAVYDGNGGAGWFAVVSAKGQTQTLSYTLSSLAVTSLSTDFSCANQTLTFSKANEAVLMTIAEHITPEPYLVTVPAGCNQVANVYIGNSIAPANQIAVGVTTSLTPGVNTFTVQLIPNPTVTSIGAPCNIQIQDAYVGSTGGAAFPGATTYMAAVLSGATYQQITVP
jgi:hypothetical protein